jgi:toxin ParE1/3/4
MIKYSPDARADIVATYRYGAAEFGRNQAEAYATHMREAIHLLEVQPKLAPLHNEYMPPVRIHTWRNHYIVYQTSSAGIYIVRILHQASDLTRHL